MLDENKLENWNNKPLTNSLGGEFHIFKCLDTVPYMKAIAYRVPKSVLFTHLILQKTINQRTEIDIFSCLDTWVLAKKLIFEQLLVW